MKKAMLMAFVLLAAGSAGYAAAECGETELAAGTDLGDGTVAGEKEALAYFKEKVPELHAKLSALTPEQRKEHAPSLVWFQRVGRCRQAQKAESIMKLQVEFGLPVKAPLAAAAPAAKAAATGECGGGEEQAGFVLRDGTVAGEKEMLDYLKVKESELHVRLMKVSPQERRARFSGQMMWFQRVGNCRTRQKEESVRQLRAELAVEALVDEYKTVADPKRKAELAARARAVLGERFDSDITLMVHQVRSMEAGVLEFEEEVESLRRETERLRREFTERQKARAAIIDKRLKELLSKS